MNTELNQNEQKRNVSQQMHAVLTILNSNEEFLSRVQSHINLENESIDWDQIFKQSWSSGQRGVLAWAYNLWRDEYQKGINSFASALDMDRVSQSAVIRALTIRWGLGHLG